MHVMGSATLAPRMTSHASRSRQLENEAHLTVIVAEYLRKHGYLK
jgi:hypothetical protein